MTPWLSDEWQWCTTGTADATVTSTVHRLGSGRNILLLNWQRSKQWNKPRINTSEACARKTWERVNCFTTSFATIGPTVSAFSVATNWPSRRSFTFCEKTWVVVAERTYHVSTRIQSATLTQGPRCTTDDILFWATSSRPRSLNCNSTVNCLLWTFLGTVQIDYTHCRLGPP